MLLKCTFSPNTSWWFLDTNTPTITAKNNYHCCNNHHCCLIVGFSPLVTCTTFFCCPSKKCHHSAHLVLTYQWQYYIDHCRKRQPWLQQKTQKNKATTKNTTTNMIWHILCVMPYLEYTYIYMGQYPMLPLDILIQWQEFYNYSLKMMITNLNQLQQHGQNSKIHNGPRKRKRTYTKIQGNASC